MRLGNPHSVVKSSEEHLWAQTKALAAAQGRAGDWPYVMGIFKRSRRENPAPPAGARPPRASEVVSLARDLGVPNNLVTAFLRGVEIKWGEHGGGLPLDAIGQLVLDHLQQDPRYYRRRKNPAEDKGGTSEEQEIDEAVKARVRVLLESTPLDKNGRVALKGAALASFLKQAIALYPDTEKDRYGNYVVTKPGARKTRYHFTPQRLKYQMQVAGGWRDLESYTFQEAAQVVLRAFAKLVGDEELLGRLRAGARAIADQKEQRVEKEKVRKEQASSKVRTGVALELIRPDLVRAIVLDGDRSAQQEATSLFESLKPVPPGPLDVAPGAFLLVPFALPLSGQPKEGFIYRGTSAAGPVSIVQQPVDSGVPFVQKCNLHIGKTEGELGLRVDPRSGRPLTTYSTSEIGPGYLSATFDRVLRDDIVHIESTLYFVQANERRRGVGRALVELWLNHCINAVGGDESRLLLRVKGILEDARPFWQALHDAGVFTIVGDSNSTAHIVRGRT
jgi:hypothetical protein